MPRAPKRCGRNGCDDLMPCEVHAPPPRPSRQSRLYDAEHDRRAASLRAASDEHSAPCSLCAKPIDYSLRSPHPRSFVAHHTTRDKRGPLAPAHRRCNERAGEPAPF
jgi:hypothetical protein